MNVNPEEKTENKNPDEKPEKTPDVNQTETTPEKIEETRLARSHISRGIRPLQARDKKKQIYPYYLSWFCTPDALREPDEKNLTMFQRKYDISRMALNKWRKSKTWQDDIKAEYDRLSNERVLSVKQRLYSLIFQKNKKKKEKINILEAIRLYAEWEDKLKTKIDNQLIVAGDVLASQIETLSNEESEKPLETQAEMLTGNGTEEGEIAENVGETGEEADTHRHNPADTDNTASSEASKVIRTVKEVDQ